MSSNISEEKVGDLQVSWDNVEDNAPAPSLNNVDNAPLFEQIHRYHQDTEQRLFLAKWVVWTSSVWLIAVIIILILSGCEYLKLSDIVLNVLLATTTANVLGLAYIVLKGLFGQKDNKMFEQDRDCD